MLSLDWHTSKVITPSLEVYLVSQMDDPCCFNLCNTKIHPKNMIIPQWIPTTYCTSCNIISTCISLPPRFLWCSDNISLTPCIYLLSRVFYQDCIAVFNSGLVYPSWVSYFYLWGSFPQKSIIPIGNLHPSSFTSSFIFLTSYLKFMKFKLDEDPLQRRFYFIYFTNSIKNILSQLQ